MCDIVRLEPRTKKVGIPCEACVKISVVNEFCRSLSSWERRVYHDIVKKPGSICIAVYHRLVWKNSLGCRRGPVLWPLYHNVLMIAWERTPRNLGMGGRPGILRPAVNWLTGVPRKIRYLRIVLH
jgi:hypothetical protein